MLNPIRLESGQLIRVRAAVSTVIALLLTAASTPNAQSSPVAGPGNALRVSPSGRVRGQVFDSLLMQPVPGAQVWLPGGTQTATTDANGRYELTSIPTGSQFISFSTPALDSLGLGAMGRTVVVEPDAVTSLALATPSFRRVWAALCGGASVGRDSGIVWGTVRDAATDIRQHGAEARFNWYDARVGKDKKLSFNEETRTAKTDSTGTYYGCGLPADVRVSSEAAGAQSASGVVEYLIGARRILRVDLLVSKDMVLHIVGRAQTPSESIAVLRPRGSATLTGHVRDTKGNLLRDVMVTVGSVDSAFRTDASGQFRIQGLAAGTHGLQVRQVGFAPASAWVDLRPDSITTTQFVMTSARELETFNVRAERVAGVDKRAFDERRAAGFGYALEYKEFKNRADVASIFQNMPGVTLQRRRIMGQARGNGSNQGEFILKMTGGGAPPVFCDPPVYVDGALTSLDQVGMSRIEDIRAVEVYPRYFQAPPQYVGREKCGVILVWTKHARW